MNVADIASPDDNTLGGGAMPPCTGLTPDALPEVQDPTLEENSLTGVSTRNAPLPNELQEARRAARTPRWYVLRCAYGQERKASEYLASKGVTIYYPTRKRTVEIEGKRKCVEESYIPNFLFAHGLFEGLKVHVYDNAHKETKPLRFYCSEHNDGGKKTYKPIVVPEYQMESLRIICSSESKDIIIVPSDIKKFETGQLVRITEGKFKGVTGKVARYQGQQRVGIIIEGILTICTAYVPSAFLETMKNS